MMRYQTALALIMSVAIGGITAIPLHASETDANRCVNVINHTVERLEQSLAERTAETVTIIDRLLQAGRFEAAAAAARDCVSASRTDVRAANLYINRMANACIRHLIEQEQFKTARRLDQFRDDALERILNALSRQERVLAAALGD